MQITIQPIGTIHTSFHTPEHMPIQPVGGMEHTGTITIDPSYAEGLKDLEGFSHIYLIYYFHKIPQHKLTVIPFVENTQTPRGVFATRAPTHPNLLGLSLVKLIKIEDNVIIYQGVDILDGTPLIDIKPYIRSFDHVDGEVRSGWMQSSLNAVKEKRSDERFKKG